MNQAPFCRAKIGLQYMKLVLLCRSSATRHQTSEKTQHHVDFYSRFVRELLVVSLATSSNCVYCASETSEEEDIAI